MDKQDALIYKSDVERTLEQLRVKCFGLDRMVTDILPEEKRGLTPEGQAAWIAGQILFQLVKLYPDHSADELGESGEWLYSTTLFLLTRISTTDRTFKDMIKVIRLDPLLRKELFAPIADQAEAIREGMFTPEPLEHLQLAVLCLLDSKKMLKSGKRDYQVLNGMLNS